MEKQTMDWEYVFLIHISDKGFYVEYIFLSL